MGGIYYILFRNDPSKLPFQGKKDRSESYHVDYSETYPSKPQTIFRESNSGFSNVMDDLPNMNSVDSDNRSQSSGNVFGKTKLSQQRSKSPRERSREFSATKSVLDERESGTDDDDNVFGLATDDIYASRIKTPGHRGSYVEETNPAFGSRKFDGL